MLFHSRNLEKRKTRKRWFKLCIATGTPTFTHNTTRPSSIFHKRGNSCPIDHKQNLKIKKFNIKNSIYKCFFTKTCVWEKKLY